MRRFSFVGCGAAFLGVAFALTPYGGAEAAAERTITGQATYNCAAQSPDGGPTYTETFGVRLSLNVPSTVSPGSNFAPKGTFTFQFPPSAYQTNKALGISSGQASSDDISTTVITNGRATRVVAYRWDTGPQQIRDPMVVSAPIAFPPISVPADASGEVELLMPQNGSVPNPLATGPDRVAFTLYSKSDGAAGPQDSNVSCWMPTAEEVPVGQVPVAKSSAPTDDEASPPPGTNQGGADTTPSDGLTNGTDPRFAGDNPNNDQDQTGLSASGVPGTAVGDPPSTAPGAQGAPGSAPAVAPAGATGVFVRTNMLVLLGFMVCLASLAYGALLHVRLRSVTRSLDN